ncbi:uncharacterized protein PSFLO_05354 [Pseudozyma flocculosa]|uniref:Citrate transporter-like domain-containing protein n=1 Tax=Pseudozyma flocculosa TaxID=84751 RepID=A0A5C3F5T9_9BASI|nr:uncharacterized protein PSFLO_05354 [Pseudozyma flocculosa]
MPRHHAELAPPAPAPAEAASSDTQRTSLDGHGIFAIIVFAAVSLVVIRPLRLRLPQRMAIAIRTSRRRIWITLAGDDESVAAVHQSDSTSIAGDDHDRDDDLRRPMYLTIDHVSAPLIGVLLLLATTTIGGAQIRTGIVGEDGVEPYDVLLLFISLAYIAISLDATGLLRYLAFLICLKSGKRGQEGSGRKLYLLLYFFFWSAGVLVGNDPVILSGTAFLVYLTRVAGISPPDAWIWAEFVAANISSAVLVSSNPTNLVIATGFGVEFITYTAYMVLPAFASAVAALACLLVFFRNRKVDKVAPGRVDSAQRRGRRASEGTSGVAKTGNGMRQRAAPSSQAESNSGDAQLPAGEATDGASQVTAQTSLDEHEDHQERKRAPLIYIPHRIIQPDVDARSALVDLPGAIFGSIAMAATLATLVGTSVVGGVKVFEIAVPGAVLCLARDGVADYLRSRKENKRQEKESQEAGARAEDRETAAAASATADGTSADVARAVSSEGQDGIGLAPLGVSKTAADPVTAQVTAATAAAAVGPSSETSPEAATPTSSTRPLTPAKPRAHRPLRPLLLLPGRLAQTFPTVSIVLSRLPLPLLPFAFGMFILVQALAHVGFINILAGGLGTVCAHGYVATAFFISSLGVVLCNIGGTNIGATILLTKSTLSPFFHAKLAHLATADQERILKMATYSIAFGSNVGALAGTFSSSLAGLLWLSGLRQGGITVRARQFALWCAVVVGPATVAGVAVLIAEVRYFHL